VVDWTVLSRDRRTFSSSSPRAVSKDLSGTSPILDSDWQRIILESGIMDEERSVGVMSLDQSEVEQTLNKDLKE